MGDKGYAFSAAIPVDGPHEDDFGRDMGEVSYDSERVTDGHFDGLRQWPGEVHEREVLVVEESVGLSNVRGQGSPHIRRQGGYGEVQ